MAIENRAKLALIVLLAGGLGSAVTFGILKLDAPKPVFISDAVSVPVQQIAADATAPSPVVLKTSSRKRSSGARKPRGEKSSRTASAKKITSGTISINAATVDELEELPGVGPSTAQSIIDFRTKAGGFSSLDELGDIPRMGQKKLAKLMPFIRL